MVYRRKKIDVFLIKKAMKELTIKDLPGDVVAGMKKAIRDDRQMIALENKRASLLRARKYVQALDLKKRMDEIEDRVIKDYLSSYVGEAESMANLMIEMTREDRDIINVCTNAIILICDMIETFTMDFNEVLHKYHPDYRLEMYDKIMQVGQEAKSHVKFMSECTDNFYQCSFADSADDVTNLVRNKARSLIRRINTKVIVE